MRRPQFRRLQDRRTERLLRRNHAPESSAPRGADLPGGAAPTSGGGALGPDDVRRQPAGMTAALVVSDAA